MTSAASHTLRLPHSSALGVALGLVLAARVGVALAQPVASSDAGDVPGSRDASASPELVGSSDPADPYSRDPVAPVTVAGEARGYELEPRAHRSNLAVRAVAGLGVGLGYVAEVVFLPLRGAVYLESRHKLASKAKALLYNDAETFGVLPSVEFLTGFGTSLGASAFYRDWLGNDEKISVKAVYGGRVDQAYQAKLEMEHLAGTRLYLNGRARWERNSNLFFKGIGHAPELATGSDLDPRAAAIETRYQQQRWLGVLSAGTHVDRAKKLGLGVTAIYNDRRFDELAADASATSIGAVYDTALLPGFADGIRVLELSVDFELDTRDSPATPGSGVVVRGFAGHTAPLDNDYSFYHYGLESSLYWTPAQSGRVVVFRLAHDASYDDGELPFTDQPRLGGAGLLRGYHIDRFRDDLAAIATIEYRYPVHFNISGMIFAETGKVARTYSELLGKGFTDDWRLGYGGGLIMHTPTGVKVRVDLAYGDGLQLYFSTDVLDAFRKREKEL